MQGQRLGESEPCPPKEEVSGAAEGKGLQLKQVMIATALLLQKETPGLKYGLLGSAKRGEVCHRGGVSMSGVFPGWSVILIPNPKPIAGAAA